MSNGQSITTGMIFHTGMMFSTFDQDNDANSGHNCAQQFLGGWW
jgi:hypothetical protein